MKKIVTFTLLFVLALTLFACGDKEEPTPTAPVPTEAAPAEEAATEEETMPEETSEEPAAEEEAAPEEETAEEPVAEEEAAPEGETAEEPVTEDEAAPDEEAMEIALYQEAIAQNVPNVVALLNECPQRSFPVPDPDSNAKRPLDFTPFSEAMAGFTAEQATGMDAALAGKTLPEIQEMLNNGDFTSEQLVLYYLDRIQRYDVDKLNSVMELNPDVLAIAQELDAERAGDTRRSDLHGIPILLKDNIATGDQMHTTAGNYALKDWQADRDAFLVQQLRDAGAIIMGKANLSEWANYTDPCMPNGFSAVGGQVRHPYGPYDPMGSSTGSAVSVAADLTTVSVGSETAGSLTQPAGSNGVVGMRPSQGLISRDYVVPLEANLDTPGPMGHSVSDVAILLTAMAGTDANDPKTADAAALADTDFTQFLSVEEAQKVKVGVVQFDRTGVVNLFNAGGITEEEIDALTPEEFQQISDTLVAPGIWGATQATIDALESQGIEMVVIKESEFPETIEGAEVALLEFGFQNAANTFFTGLGDSAPVTSLAEAVEIVNEDLANRAPYGQRYVEWSANTEITADEYDAILHGGQSYSAAWMQWFKDTYDVDVIFMGMKYAVAGPAGIPALIIPTGQNVEESGQLGQPTAVVLTGPYLSDAQLIAVGYALEQALNVNLQPDLDATIQQIEAVTGQ